ncbi:hypothetical protein F0562_000569 [Nyssa sinensis]|uniref:Auxin-responsive protein n=1 Tax=Nyssa sinensis TaxID=561372 RepID=A0A5J5C0H5_9ASTE|nr:hypothetical protein F0562_000569 [Nyssa sinensis]
MSILKPFQLLEINVISAQDLEPVSKNMRTYATAWVHPIRKLTTRVDNEGRNNPTWNDKFVFRVDEEFLCADTSAVMIEIYAVHWFRDCHVGTVRILVGNLIPPLDRQHHQYHGGMRFVALQVRRPSGRPQGILNIGVSLLDSSMRSMPLYTQLSSSAVGFRDLMREEDPHPHHHNRNNNNNPPIVKPILRRSKSERSERVTFHDLKGSQKGSSIISGSSVDPPKGKARKGKASSVISGAELRERPNEKGKKGKASSVISGSEIKKPSKDKPRNEKPEGFVNENAIVAEPSKEKLTSEKLGSQLIDSQIDKVTHEKIDSKIIPTAKPNLKLNGYEFGAPKGSVVNGKFIYGGGPVKVNSIWSDSEVGPSPSEVAAAMAVEKYPLEENRSSVLDGWSLDESVEGLRSKLERWRTELPPLYDRGFSSSSFRSTSQHVRRHTDGGGGLFSCFGNIYGYECQCICGPWATDEASVEVSAFQNKFSSLDLMETTLGLLGGGGGGGGGGLLGTSVNETDSTVSKAAEQDYVGMSSEASSYPNEAGLELGLGLSLGGGGGGTGGFVKAKGSTWGEYGRILTAKDFPTGFSGRANASAVGAISGTKRAAESSAPSEVGSASTGVSQVVGWPPIRAYRMNSLVNQSKTPNAEEDKVVGENDKSKNSLKKTNHGNSKSDAGVKEKGLLGFVKVNMDGLQIGRKVDLNAHACYETLAQTLEEMFFRPTTTISSIRSGGEKERATQPSKLLDGTSEFVLTYEDKEGDWMLVGDVPWGMFLGTVKRLRIMRTSEANGLAPRFQERIERQRSKPI